MAQTTFVRAASPHLQLVTEIEGPNNTVTPIHVHGFDELGRPVCPVFEVPQCEIVLSAIYKENIFDVNEKGEKIERSAGRLVLVEPTTVDQFPRWIGHPKKGDSLDQIIEKTKSIRAEQVKGDRLLGLVEPSQPYVPPVDILMDSTAESLEARVKAIEAFEARLNTNKTDLADALGDSLKS